MKFKINTILFQTVCNVLVKAASSKDISPIMKNFYLEAKEGNIKTITHPEWITANLKFFLINWQEHYHLFFTRI